MTVALKIFSSPFVGWETNGLELESPKKDFFFFKLTSMIGIVHFFELIESIKYASYHVDSKSFDMISEHIHITRNG